MFHENYAILTHFLFTFFTSLNYHPLFVILIIFDLVHNKVNNMLRKFNTIFNFLSGSVDLINAPVNNRKPIMPRSHGH